MSEGCECCQARRWRGNIQIAADHTTTRSNCMKESNIQRLIMMAMSQQNATIFRNNTGNAVAGSHYKRIDKSGQYLLEAGDWVVKHGNRVQYGLCVGSSDLIGWKPLVVTPEMVGHRIAQFLAAEIKTATGRATDEQMNFIQAVRKAGGTAGILRSVDDTTALLNQFIF